MVRVLRSAKQVANKIHEVAGSATYANGAIRMWRRLHSPTRMRASSGTCSPATNFTNPNYQYKRPRTKPVNERINKEVSPSNCNKMAGDGETVIPSLPEPGVWTGMASADV